MPNGAAVRSCTDPRPTLSPPTSTSPSFLPPSSPPPSSPPPSSPPSSSVSECLPGSGVSLRQSGELLDSTRKRLHGPSSGGSVHSRLLREYGYSKAKRFKTTPASNSHSLSLCMEAREAVEESSTVRNPFAKSLIHCHSSANSEEAPAQRTLSEPQNSDSSQAENQPAEKRECLPSPPLQGNDSSNSIHSSLAPSNNHLPFSGHTCSSASITTETHPRQTFMTSADFITTPTATHLSVAGTTLSGGPARAPQIIDLCSESPKRRVCSESPKRRVSLQSFASAQQV